MKDIDSGFYCGSPEAIEQLKAKERARKNHLSLAEADVARVAILHELNESFRLISAELNRFIACPPSLSPLESPSTDDDYDPLFEAQNAVAKAIGLMAQSIKPSIETPNPNAE